jgi:hypothetical protein
MINAVSGFYAEGMSPMWIPGEIRNAGLGKTYVLAILG